MKKRLIAWNPRLSKYTINTDDVLNEIKRKDDKLVPELSWINTKIIGESVFAGLYYDSEHNCNPPYIYSVELYIYQDVKTGGQPYNYLASYAVKLRPNYDNTDAVLDTQYSYVSISTFNQSARTLYNSGLDVIIVNNVKLKLLKSKEYKDAYHEAIQELQKLQ